MIAKIPGFVKKLYPRRIWCGPSAGKTLYLTFDDGPFEQVTPWVLEELQKYDAKATFFCIGKNIKKNPDIFRRIIEEGHSVGNHTYDHLNGWKSDSGKYRENVLKARERMQEASPGLPLKNDLFRPPYGRLKDRQAKLLRDEGFTTVMWDVLSMDFDNTVTPERCVKNVTGNAGPGSLVVFHDSLKARKNLQYALPVVLEHFQNKGFEFQGL